MGVRENPLGGLPDGSKSSQSVQPREEYGIGET